MRAMDLRSQGRAYMAELPRMRATSSQLGRWSLEGARLSFTAAARVVLQARGLVGKELAGGRGPRA